MDTGDVFKQFVPYIFGTGVVTVILTLAVDKAFVLLNNRKEQKYSSVRVAVILESYALACSDFINRNEYFGNRYGYNEQSLGLTSENKPMLEDFPAEINWKEIKPSLASKALSLNAEELMTSYLLEGLTDDEHGWDKLIEIHKIVGYNGYKAWMLANELRTSASLPRIETLNFEKDLEKCLTPFYKKSIEEANMRKSFNT